MLFYTANAFAYMSFLKIAIGWPALMRQWEVVEKNMPTFRTVNGKRNKMYLLKAVAWGFLTIALRNYLTKYLFQSRIYIKFKLIFY